MLSASKKAGNSVIEFANSDSTIWHRDQLIMQIAAAMSAQQPRIDLSTKNEGPCAASLGLYDLLDQLCAEFRYDPRRIHIKTCNLVEAHPVYNINIDPNVYYLQSAQRYTTPDTAKQIDADFKHFGNFIGHGNVHRLYLASVLRNVYGDIALQTYHCDPTSEYHRAFVGIEDMMHLKYSAEEVRSALKLIEAAPITQDAIDQYPILNPTTLNITKLYPRFFVEIVNLTYWSGNTFYLDEKIWRPILMRTPFIVQGPQHFMSRFRTLGFRTFDAWWDEGHSEDPADYQPRAIAQLLNQISQYTLSDIRHILADMQDTLEHNYQLMMRITRRDLHA